MARAFWFTLAVLFLTTLTADADDGQDLKTLKYNKKIVDAVQLLFPMNTVKKVPSSANAKPHNATICGEEMKLLQQALLEGELWAYKMVDASSKIPAGVISGNRVDLGMFDECVEISTIEKGQHIRGRHCMYNVMAELGELPISQTLSICVPASCDAEDVEGIVKTRVDPMAKLLLPNISLTFGSATCTSVDPPEWTSGGIATLAAFSVLLLFLVVCTICDVCALFSKQKPSRNGALDTLRQFSLYSNAVRLLSTKAPPQTLPALHGIRFFSMCWVIMAHAHVVSYFQPTINLVEIILWLPTWRSLYLVAAPFAVDTFLALSGFLMSYMFLNDMSKTGKFNIFSYYLHRYIRVTPSLIAMALIVTYITPRLGSGALWESGTTFETRGCQRNLGWLALYIQNYMQKDQACMGHTWYLAVEMQFFWLSPLIMYPLSKKPKLGLGILAAFFFAAVATPVIIGYKNQYTSAVVSGRQFSGPESGTTLNDFYFASHVRCAPWLIGILNGYTIFTRKGSPSKAVKWFGWLMTVFAFSFCIFTMRVFEDDDYGYDVVWESIYTALARPLWACGVSWIIYACIRGFAGPISTFLSFSIYNPLGRVSYCTYLWHYHIQFMKSRAARTSYNFSTFNGFDRFLSDLVESLVLGFFMALIVENPFMLLEKLAKKWMSRTKKDNSNKARGPEEGVVIYYNTTAQ